MANGNAPATISLEELKVIAQKAGLELPEGATVKSVMDAFAAHTKLVADAKAKEKANMKAFQRVKTENATLWEKLVNEERKKLGIAPLGAKA